MFWFSMHDIQSKKTKNNNNYDIELRIKITS